MTKDIVLCFDRFFIKPIMVLLKSIEISNPNENFVIHIVFSGEGEKESLKKLLQDVVSKEFFTFHFYEIDENLLASCPIRKGDYVNISTYYRILLPTILPPTVERVLYLDGDMLVVDSMSELWGIDLENYGAAVVPCIYYDKSEIFQRLGIDKSEGYFNAGMMFINLKYWREHDVQTRTLSFIKNNPDLCVKHDQDALNYILSDQLLYLSIKFNYQRIFFERGFSFCEKLKEDVLNSAYYPCIIHYCDFEKPWHKECFHPLANVWRFVATIVFGSKYKLQRKYTKAMYWKYIIKHLLAKFGIVKLYVFPTDFNFVELSARLIKHMELQNQKFRC